MEYRLKRSEDFDKVFKKGKRVFSDGLTLIYLRTDSVKVGYAVGKKYGCSVKRNRRKRLLRDAFRKYIPLVKGNFFFIFIPHVAEEYSVKKFDGCMNYMLKKNGII